MRTGFLTSIDHIITRDMIMKFEEYEEKLLRQPLEDIVSSYYELLESFDELEKVSDRLLFFALEDYLIHMKII